MWQGGGRKVHTGAHAPHTIITAFPPYHNSVHRFSKAVEQGCVSSWTEVVVLEENQLPDVTKGAIPFEGR